MPSCTRPPPWPPLRLRSRRPITASLFSPFSEAAWCGDNGAARKGEKAARKGEKRRPLSESEEWAAEWDRYRALRTCTDISEADRAWMVRYEASPEFRAYRRLEERAA